MTSGKESLTRTHLLIDVGLPPSTPQQQGARRAHTPSGLTSIWNTSARCVSAEWPEDSASVLHTNAQACKLNGGHSFRNKFLSPTFCSFFSVKKRYYNELFNRELGGLSFEEKINKNILNVSCQKLLLCQNNLENSDTHFKLNYTIWYFYPTELLQMWSGPDK